MFGRSSLTRLTRAGLVGLPSCTDANSGVLGPECGYTCPPPVLAPAGRTPAPRRVTVTATIASEPVRARRLPGKCMVEVSPWGRETLLPDHLIMLAQHDHLAGI